jgi:hypothetical protein
MVTHDPGNAVALAVDHDPARGGRWTSLTGGGREWLWRRPGVDRHTVVTGDPFVDAGGLEECLPTIRGLPDHGDLWSRAWQRVSDEVAVIACPTFSLHRRLRACHGAVVADYNLSADPGYRFLWAAHALLDLTPQARLDAPAETPTRLYPEAVPLLVEPWPNDSRWFEGPWPAPAGLRLDQFGPDDGTAVGAILTGCPTVRVIDGSDQLTLHLDADGQPRSTALWRNLRGWPHPGPYRSIGIEPMLGAVFDLAEAEPADAATVPASGELTWQLTITAHRRGGSNR